MYIPAKPSRKPTENMIKQPFKNVVDFCGECSVMNAALDAGIGNFDIGELRTTCTCCKNADNGIFKADAIYSALQLDRQFRRGGNRGKKPTLEKKYGHAIRKLRDQRMSIKGISEILGLHYNSVQRFLAEEKKKDAETKETTADNTAVSEASTKQTD